MATRNFRPNADKEGQLGTATYKWQKIGFYQYMEAVNDLGTVSSNQTIDLADGSVVKMTLGADITLSFTGWTSGVCETVSLMINPSTHSVTWPSGIKWENNAVPSLEASQDNWVFLWSMDGGTTIYGSYGYDYQ